MQWVGLSLLTLSEYASANVKIIHATFVTYTVRSLFVYTK